MRQPLAAPRLIDRPRLLRQWEKALASGHILLTAPAGYGKSVALHALAAHRRDAHYIPLRPAHQDVAVLRESCRPLLQPQNTLLLDDIHLLATAPEASQWLQEQLARPRPRWVLAGRRLPFDGTLTTVSGKATHFTKELLAFSPGESSALLSQARQQVQDWAHRLHGWPLALSLLARIPAGEDPLPATTAHLFPYLAAAVFDRLPPALKQFMRVTAVPVRFNATLAAAIWPGHEAASALLEEIQRRDLFLQADHPPGWWRYHDLIRAYLLKTVSFAARPVAAQTIAWFEQQGDQESAIEQALASDFPNEAARLLEQVSDAFLWDHARHLTFHRWVHSLEAEVQAAHPQLLVRLAQSLHYLSGRQAEAWQTLRRAEAIYARAGDLDRLRAIRRHMAWFHMAEGAYKASLEELDPLLANPDCRGLERLQVLYQAGSAHAYLGHFGEAEAALDSAVGLALALDDDRRAAALGEKLALHVYIPRGRFAQAQRAMEAVEPYYAGKPSYRIQYLLIIADLYAAQGNWPALAATVDELAERVAQLELAENHQVLWTAFYQAWLAVANRDIATHQVAVATVMATMQQKADQDPVARLCLARLQLWALRRGMHREEEATMAHTDQLLAHSGTSAVYYRALLALERDILTALQPPAGTNPPFTLHPETWRLLNWRCRADLVRLRALLAVVCYRVQNPRWPRHLHAAVRALRTPGYEHLLTHRDPELGAAFWQVALTSGQFLEQAHVALVATGQVEALLPLLRHSDAPVRRRAAAVLADMGREEALPALTSAQNREEVESVRQELAAVTDRLVHLPPPPITVHCFGNFRLWRGQELVSPQAWSRPIVYRLFCYFALHQGETFSRERLLDDLWPHTDPGKSWNTFRTVFSLLRKVLEPYLPPKVPMRYIILSGERFEVDPVGVMQVDARQFERSVTDLLARRHSDDQVSLAQPLSAVLGTYQPLLPDLALEDWLLEPRQRLQELFGEGCLLASQSFLAQARHENAVQWAKRALETAPWLEEAYQVLMRTYARQGQRTLALRTYEQATASLQQELGIAPSPLTDWLVERLRRGEQI